MRVTILTTGRFHVLDLARELSAHGHEVRFISLVPPWRTRRHGLPHGDRWLGPALGPLWLAYRGLSRLPHPGPRDLALRALTEALDRTAAALLGPCDALISMSGMGLHTLRRAKRLGALTLIERGSMHIEAQREILEASGAGQIPPWVIARELTEYSEADHIVVPSLHAEQSFRERGLTRLFRNPYGVSLAEFRPSPAPKRRQLLMVGAWSRQKGADTLVEAFRLLRARPAFADLNLTHVGPVGDAPLPTMAGFTHHPPVPQAELARFYAAASVAVLPSRQDGFGMVLCQALAAGVPIVCSTRTGGPDLAAMVAARDAIRLTRPDDPAALSEALAAALADAPSPGTPRNLLTDAEREALSWAGYGARYDAFLRDLLAARVSR